MSTETSAPARPSASYRPDSQPQAGAATLAAPRDRWTWGVRFGLLATLATGFVLLAGGNLDPDAAESKLGLSAFERLGPFGQVFGGWEPSIWPMKQAMSLVWAWGEGGMPTSGAIRWPQAIAGVVIGLILARRAAMAYGGRAGVLVGLCWYSSLGVVDHSGMAGVDLVAGLGTVAALDRLLGRGADLRAGLWGAFAFLAGGWPPLAIILMASMVLGRRASYPGWRLLAPMVVAGLAWSSWALRVAPTEAWAAALTLPLTEKPSWFLAGWVALLGLPWSPLALLAASRSVREGWPTPSGRALLVGWLQVTGACLLAGTVVPGLATAALVPALAGLAIVAGGACERLLAGAIGDGPGLSTWARRWAFAASIGLTVAWLAIVVPFGGWLAASVPYYRSLAVWLMIFAPFAAAGAIWGAWRRDARGALAAVFAMAVFLKLAHCGYYVPEWNYRYSQGPWGRAVGQWIPARWPIYTTHAWRTDLAFATGRPFRQLFSPQHLEYAPGEAKFVLLVEPEYENWPETAPKLIRVAKFQDEYDSTRVLARTAGPLPWTRPARIPRD